MSPVRFLSIFILSVIAVSGMTYALWPLILLGERQVRQRWYRWQLSTVDNKRRLSSYEQLLRMLDGDRFTAKQLLDRLRQQYPDRAEDWYSETVLEQLKLWIVNTLSSRQNDASFGINQVAAYTLKYPHYPSWWVYRQVARDFNLLQRS